jgi:NADPH-dependent curcumin reductase
MTRLKRFSVVSMGARVCALQYIGLIAFGRFAPPQCAVPNSATLALFLRWRCRAVADALQANRLHAARRHHLDQAMPQTDTTNRAIVLASRPVGAPTAANFTLRESRVPPLLTGELLLRTLYLSLDPYMRGRMSDAPSYAAPVPLGAVMVGSTVSVVQASHHTGFSPGELVLGSSGWQDYAVSDGHGLTTLPIGTQHPSQALGVLGMPGFTAYMGLLDIGRPHSGDTVVVAAASGAVGSVVGQLAKLHGCRAVGIAGGAEKCAYVVDELGFDACIDHHGDQLPARLAAACPRGIDVYFESVGGAVFDAVMPLLNPRARVPVCGLISNYNDTALPSGPDRMGALVGLLLRRRIKMQGFIIFEDYGERYGEFSAAMAPLVDAGKIKFREDVVFGLENAPEAFIGLLQGANFGKLVIQVAPA